MKYSSKWILGLIAAAAPIACSDNVAPEEVVARGQGLAVSSDAGKNSFRHALMPENWLDMDLEGLPFVDTSRGPTGGQLTVRAYSKEDEEGNVGSGLGLSEVGRRKLEGEELTWLKSIKTPRISADPLPVVPEAVTALREDPKPHVFLISIRRDGVKDVATLVDRDVVLGLVHDEADYMLARDRALESRRSIVSERQAPIVADVIALGGRVVTRFTALFSLTVEMTAAQLLALVARNSNIGAVDLDAPGEVEFVGDAGASVSAGSQLTKMILEGFDGEPTGLGRIRMAQYEGGGLKVSHVGFKDGTGSTKRIGTLEVCTSGSCTSPGSSFNPADVTQHATLVANVLFGDLNDGQDSGITDGNDRIDKSGYANEGFLQFAIKGIGSEPMITAMNFLAGQPSNVAPRIINKSSAPDPDPEVNCSGTSTISDSINQLFEVGQLVFHAVGNTGHSDPTDCTTRAPATAIGAFAVGAHGVDSATDPITVSEVRTEDIDPASARGGGKNATEGQGRTIVDLTAYGCRKELFDTSGAYSNVGCGTSISAPTVAAAAGVFADFFSVQFGQTLLDLPGILHANMLLMGDRKAEGLATKTSGFDSLWGGGRLRMRSFNNAGLDAPTEYITGWTCVDQFETVTVGLNCPGGPGTCAVGNTLPSTVNVVKAVIFFYDPEHGFGTPIDDIDLVLRDTTSNTTVASSVSSHDEKEQVLYGSPGGKKLSLDIIGFDVDHGDQECGTPIVNSMKVYYAVFWEDSARDDVDGPSNSGAGTDPGDVVPEL